MKFVDFFCGAGGFSLGFIMAGFEPVISFEINFNVCRTYSKNIGNHVVCMDVASISSSLLTRLKGKIDVVIASPPCEGFTPLNPKRVKDPVQRFFDDPLANLSLKTFEIIKILEPKYFVIENVPDMAQGKAKHFIRSVLSEKYGEIYFNILDAQRFKVPSYRKRLFISNIMLFAPQRFKLISVGEVLNFPEPDLTHTIKNHLFIPPPRKAKLNRSWGKASTFFKGSGKVFKDLIRLDPRRPAPTVRGSARFIHPLRDRLLSPREQATLNSWPVSYEFTGSVTEQYNMIGEAVPPLVAYDIAKQILKHYDKMQGSK